MSERIQHIATTTAYITGGSTAAAGMLTLNEWALIIGIVTALGTFTVNLIYKHLHYKLAKKDE